MSHYICSVSLISLFLALIIVFSIHCFSIHMIVLHFFVIIASFSVYVMSPNNSCAVPKHFLWCLLLCRPQGLPMMSPWCLLLWCPQDDVTSCPQTHKHTKTCHSEKISHSACKQANATKNAKFFNLLFCLGDASCSISFLFFWEYILQVPFTGRARLIRTQLIRSST